MAKLSPPRQRVGVPADVRAALRASARSGDVLLREVFSAAVRGWLDRRAATVGAGQPMTYVRTPRALVDQLVELDGDLLARVKDAAGEDGVSVRAVLFHALVDAAKSSPPP